MCGVFGVYSSNSVNLVRARKALSLLNHRGPDQWSEYVGDGVYVGHQRLSIRDLSERGRQPFVDSANGVVVAVNGEIWNDRELRQELGEERFHSDSDCEVFLHGYITWGLDKLLEKLDGFFGAAVYDQRTGQLHLIKDRWGKKPLYYAKSGDSVIFASEAKSILEYDASLRVFDYEGIKHWIAYRGSHCEKTIFYNVNKVVQGHYVTIDEFHNIESTQHFCHPKHVMELEPLKVVSAAEVDEQVSQLLSGALEKRLASDVPIGIQLSGGVDSSLIAAKLREETSSNISSFSVIFNDAQDKAYSEESYSDYVADKYQLNHHKLAIDKSSISEALRHVVYLFDGMLDIPNAIPIYLLCKYAKKDITVFLTGEGADELFGGYGKFNKAVKYEKANPISKLIPDGFFNLNFFINRVKHNYIYSMYLSKYYSGETEKLLDHVNSFVSPFTIEKYFGNLESTLVQHLDMDTLSRLPFMNQLLLVDHMTYLNFLLERQDKSSMGASVEARLPFLDMDLINYAFQLPHKHLLDDQMNKKPLKRLAEKYFGHDFVHRPKVGFPLPISQWLDDPEGFGESVAKIYSNDFLVLQKADKKGLMDYMASNAFDLRQVSYGDSEKVWLKWKLMVLAEAQEIFGITDIR